MSRINKAIVLALVLSPLSLFGCHEGHSKGRIFRQSEEVVYYGRVNGDDLFQVRKIIVYACGQDYVWNVFRGTIEEIEDRQKNLDRAKRFQERTDEASEIAKRDEEIKALKERIKSLELINARNEESFRSFSELSAKIHGLRCEVDRLTKKVAKDCRADWEND